MRRIRAFVPAMGVGLTGVLALLPASAENAALVLSVLCNFVGRTHAAVPAANGGTPDSGPATAVLSQIGRLMFFDTSLSASGKLACATCHDPRYAYGPPPGKAIAYGGKNMQEQGTRAIPSLRYLRSAPRFSEKHRFLDGDVGPVGGFTWDGRADSLSAQAKLPLLAANEMANAGAADVARKLARTSYVAKFRAAFGEHIFDNPRLAFEAGLLALEVFQQEPAEFYPYSSRYDAFLRGDTELTEQEERGAALFKDPAKANCASCHLGTSRDGTPPPFTDYDYVNVGVPRNPRLRANTDPDYFDLGLCGPLRRDLVDKREYCGYFRSPTLRNAALRDAFFHNGVFTSLRDVINFYNERDLYPEKYYSRNPDGSIHRFDDLPAGYPDNIDHDPPLDRKPGAQRALTEGDIDDLIAFLKTLTDGYAVPKVVTLDWREPWTEPHDAAAAAAYSDEYAWRLFVSLNWPADTRTHAPDLLARFGADKPVVWETWLSIGHVYLEGGVDPGPWTANRAPLTPERRFETFSRQDLQNLRHVVAGVMVPVVDPIASARRLTEIHMNRTAFEFVRDQELFNIEGQMRARASDHAISFPYGARDVKAKWRPISESERSRYHTLTLTLADGTRRLYGLTGLHIASKDLPNWFWATFEHVDNPTLRDNEGWQLPSRDRFACGSEHLDCNRAPAGIGLEGTVWQHYRLRGTLIDYANAQGEPQRLANSELESGMQRSASCITCHARAAIGVVGGEAVRLPVFDSSGESPDPLTRRGFIGVPDETWYAAQPGGDGRRFQRLDFVWSMIKAQHKSP
jgi:cytochrome c peroxidase